MPEFRDTSMHQRGARPASSPGEGKRARFNRPPDPTNPGRPQGIDNVRLSDRERAHESQRLLEAVSDQNERRRLVREEFADLSRRDLRIALKNQARVELDQQFGRDGRVRTFLDMLDDTKIPLRDVVQFVTDGSSGLPMAAHALELQIVGSHIVGDQIRDEINAEPREYTIPDRPFASPYLAIQLARNLRDDGVKERSTQIGNYEYRLAHDRLRRAAQTNPDVADFLAFIDRNRNALSAGSPELDDLKQRAFDLSSQTNVSEQEAIDYITNWSTVRALVEPGGIETVERSILPRDPRDPGFGEKLDNLFARLDHPDSTSDPLLHGFHYDRFLADEAYTQQIIQHLARRGPYFETGIDFSLTSADIPFPFTTADQKTAGLMALIRHQHFFPSNIRADFNPHSREWGRLMTAAKNIRDIRHFPTVIEFTPESFDRDTPIVHLKTQPTPTTTDQNRTQQYVSINAAAHPSAIAGALENFDPNNPSQDTTPGEPETPEPPPARLRRAPTPPPAEPSEASSPDTLPSPSAPLQPLTPDDERARRIAEAKARAEAAAQRPVTHEPEHSSPGTPQDRPPLRAPRRPGERAAGDINIEDDIDTANF